MGISRKRRTLPESGKVVLAGSSMPDPFKITYCTYFDSKNAVHNEPTLFIVQLDSRVKLIDIDVNILSSLASGVPPWQKTFVSIRTR